MHPVLASAVTPVGPGPLPFVDHEQVTELGLTAAEKLVLHSAAARVPINAGGHEVALFLSTKVPLVATFTSLHLMVRQSDLGVVRASPTPPSWHTCVVIVYLECHDCSPVAV